MPRTGHTEANIQRVRIGLTGLAFVFVVVLLAAVFVSPDDEEPITANSLQVQLPGAATNGVAAVEAEPKEPLAELGVAPGNVDTNSAEQPVVVLDPPPPPPGQ